MSECLNIMYKQKKFTLINKCDNYTLMKDNEQKMVILFDVGR